MQFKKDMMVEGNSVGYHVFPRRGRGRPRGSRVSVMSRVPCDSVRSCLDCTLTTDYTVLHHKIHTFRVFSTHFLLNKIYTPLFSEFVLQLHFLHCYLLSEIIDNYYYCRLLTLLHTRPARADLRGVSS